MAKIKYTKTEQKHQQDSLKQFQRFLPTLQLKKQQLQAEVRRSSDLLENNLRRWKEKGIGWAMWNFRGSMGILDSNRKDVEYENYQGLKLDRKMLELLQKYNDTHLLLIGPVTAKWYFDEMLAKAESLGKKILLPVDTVAAYEFPNPIDAPIETTVVSSMAIPDDMMGLDIGPKSAEMFAEAARTAKTVVWNGPMGVFENPVLAKGTIAVAKALAETEATTIIGGGDSAAAVNQLGFGAQMSHISTGGGASLEYLEGKSLPGVACLDDK